MKKRILSLLLMLVMLIGLLPAAHATEGDGGLALAAEGGTLQFSKNLETEPQIFTKQSWGSTQLSVAVGTYTPIGGEPTPIPDGTKISYQWYISADDQVDATDTKSYTSSSMGVSLTTMGTNYYYAVATATIDGVTYTGTSNVACVKIGAANINVTLTVNNKGVIASDKNGAAVSAKTISVVDLDADGTHTYDEALQAAHKSLMTASDYVTAESSYGLQVTKLWGVETTNTLYYLNGKAIETGVGSTELSAGDALYASINQDDQYYSDKYTAFHVSTLSTTVGLENELTLSDGEGNALPGMAIGTWSEGKFVPLEGKTTDENGKVKLTFDTAGTYVISASGTVKDTVTDYSNYPETTEIPDFDCPIMAPACTITVKNPGELKFSGQFPSNAFNYKVGEAAAFAGFYSAAYYIDGTRDYATKVTTTWYRIGPSTGGVAEKVENLTSTTKFTEADLGTWTYYMYAECEAYGVKYTAVSSFATVVVSQPGAIESSAENGFLESVTYRVGGYETDIGFETSTTDYALTHYDTSTNDLLYLTTNKSGMWYGFRIDGVKNTDDTAYNFTSTNSIKIPSSFTAGSTNVVTVLMGTKYDSNGDGTINAKDDFDVYDAYNFTVTTVPALSSLSVTDSEGNSITLDKRITSTSQLGATDVTGATSDSKIKLTANFKADTGVKLYVGETEYTSALSAQEVSLDAYKDAAGVANIPLKISYTNEANQKFEHTLTLHLESAGTFDVPVIKTQPAAESSIDKDETVKLTVEAATPETGELSYQWVYGSSSYAIRNDAYTVIDGATSASYDAPAGNVAKDTYYFCQVTLTVDGASVSTFSDAAKVTTKLTYVNPPTFSIQPGRAADKNGTGTYRTEYPAGKFDDMWMGVNCKSESVREENYTRYYYVTEPGCNQFEIACYYNATPSTEGATLIPGTITGAKSGGNFGYYFYFKPDSGLPEGTWYVYFVVTSTAKDDPAKTASTVSNFVKLTFTTPEYGFEGSGTENDPYLLKTGDDFVTIREQVESGYTLAGNYFKMVNDITLPDGWTSIGSDGANGKHFSGILDGGGYTLTFPDQSPALIHHAKGAEIRNLNIYGKEIQEPALISSSWINQTIGAWIAKIDNVTLLSGTSTLKSGLVQGSASSYNPIYISNCYAEEGVVIGYDKSQSGIGTFAAGLVGSLENCNSAATIYGVNNVGGLLGSQSNSMAAGNFVNCWFTGKIVATGSNVGGLMGAGYNSNSAPNAMLVRIQNCYVNAEITGKTNVGGFLGSNAGIEQAWENGIGYVRDNVFYGTLTGEKNVGGLVGYYSALNKYNIIENNYFYDTNGHTNAIGGVEHIDTSAREFGMGEDGIFYYDTSTDSLDDIKDFVDAEDKGTSDWQYTSVVKTNHNRTDDPMGADKENLGKAVTVEAMKDGTVLALLNASESSKKNWIQGELHPVIDDTAYISALSLSGNYKTEYYIGDTFDTTGMVFTATWSDGRTSTVSIDDVTIEGFDSSTRASLVLTASYGGVSTEFVVQVIKKPTSTEDINSITVYFTLLGDDIHYDEAGNNTTGETHTLMSNNLDTWVAKKAYKVDMNATVWDVLQKVLAENKMTCKYTMALNTVYVASITRNGVTIGEFDNGNNSGWMYTLNGKHPLLGVAQQYLENGDMIVFHYTDDYTVEEGSEDFNNPSGGTTAEDADEKSAGEVMKLIDAIGTVTEDSGEAIKTARKAYGALTEAQKKLVTNYDDLVAAEIAYAKLTGTLPFTDVAESDYCYEALLWAIEKGITNGTSATTFSPDNSCTRAQMATFLWRAAGEPKAETTTCTFTDANKDAYYYEALLWAVEKGITNGTSATAFSPENSCTRAQMVTFLWRTAGEPKAETATCTFTDVDKDAYYYEALLWAIEKGITNGTSTTTFSPDAVCTRGQMVTFLYRYMAE